MAIKKQAINKLLWIVGFFVLAVLVVMAIRHRQQGNTNDLLINILNDNKRQNFITKEDITQKIGEAVSGGLESISITKAITKIEEVEILLREDPFILNSEVFLDAHNNVMINIVQREPLLRVIDENNEHYYLDKEGIKMPLSKHFTARVLVASGAIPPYIKTPSPSENTLIKKIFELATYINKDAFLCAQIEQIAVNTKQETTLIPKVGDQKILFGKIENINKKFKRLLTFYQEGMPYEGWRKYKTIDVRFDGQVVCKKR